MYSKSPRTRTYIFERQAELGSFDRQRNHHEEILNRFIVFNNVIIDFVPNSKHGNGIG